MKVAVGECIVGPLKNPRPSLYFLRIFQGLQASGRDLNGPNTQACRGNRIQRIETCSHSPRRGTERISKQLTTVDRIISLFFDSLPGPFPDPPKPPTQPPQPQGSSSLRRISATAHIHNFTACFSLTFTRLIVRWVASRSSWDVHHRPRSKLDAPHLFELWQERRTIQRFSSVDCRRENYNHLKDVTDP